MARTSITEAEIRSILLSTAREVFLESGIRGAEMKQIAARSGLSRSTVYRYATDKSQLAFMVVEQEVRSLVESCIPANGQKRGTGYENLQAYCARLLDTLERRREVLPMIAEFDTIYQGAYPPIPQAKNYVISMQRLHNATVQLVLDGIEDHSLVHIEDPTVFVAMLSNTIFGLALRLFPREPHYLEEHHTSARATIEEFLRLIFLSVKA